MAISEMSLLEYKIRELTGQKNAENALKQASGKTILAAAAAIVVSACLTDCLTFRTK